MPIKRMTGSSVRSAAVVLAGTAALACPGTARVVGQAAFPVLPAGFIATVAGGPGGPGPARSVALGLGGGCSMPFASSAQFAAGHLYIPDLTGLVRTVNGRTGWLRNPVGGAAALAGDGIPARAAAIEPCSASRDAAGNLLIADFHSSQVRVVAARSGFSYGRKMRAGDIYTVLHDTACPGGAEGSGTFCPADVEPDHHGNLVVAGMDSNERFPGPAQIVVIAGKSGRFYGRTMRAGGSYVIVSSGLGFGIGQARVDRAGNVVVAVTNPSEIAVLAEKTGSYYGRTMKAGNLYIAAGTGILGYSGDGGPAVKAKLTEPTGVAVDLAGNLVIADTGNNRVRVVPDRSGRFYGRQMKAGFIYTVAGRPSGPTRDGVRAIRARLNLPASVAVDNAANLVVDENGRDQVRVVAEKTGRFYGRHMRAGDIYTVAGNGRQSFSGDTGPATRAQLDSLAVLAVTGARDLVIGDGGNYRVRLVPTATRIL